MESEKVKEIKEILKKRIENINPWETHALEYHKGLLDLINELERENERLNKALVDNLDAYRDGFSEGAGLKKRVDDKLKTENQQLKDRIAELEKEKTKLDIELDKRDCVDYPCRLIEKEYLKQFAERLKEISCEAYLKEQLHRCIDETLKDFIKGVEVEE